MPDSTFFCLDEDRDIVVGAVNIRHYYTELKPEVIEAMDL